MNKHEAMQNAIDKMRANPSTELVKAAMLAIIERFTISNALQGYSLRRVATKLERETGRDYYRILGIFGGCDDPTPSDKFPAIVDEIYKLGTV